ncbi:MAG: ribonuclease HII [Alphaproteobacteria bacterium]|nr:ribonuclease HII [Alphaproteobacteria bacterium]MCY4317954.1 ribonuclease HII [Alphaproteobacteria bacterium]
MPDFSLERAWQGPVAGVDEVGRGALAGPVMAAAVIVPEVRRRAVAALGLDDSKTLGPKRCQELHCRLARLVAVGFGVASVEEIDRLNILQATLLAMQRSVAALPIRPEIVLVDGNRAPTLDCPVHTVTGGDATSLSIAAASVLAKAARDRQMAALDRDWPGYGWTQNAGYGVPAHRAALARLGPTPCHRRTFRPVSKLLIPKDS